MHGSFLHIFSNMLGLWMFGNMLENLWGGKRFLTYYIVCGLGAAGIHTLFTWYEIEQVRHAVENYAAVANPVDFKLFLTRYKGFVGTEQYDHINNLYGSWQQVPNDPSLIKESVNIAYEVLKNKTDIATVGASGAVFGILLAFGMLFPNTIIYIYFAIPMKAKYFVILYGLFELYSGFQNNPADNVAHFAHLGGMLFGFIMIKYWNKRNRSHFY
jgi:membrane associated rhomboid family serine protease